MPTATRFHQLEELYHRLADLTDEDRAPLLEETQRSDPEVYEQLVRLLRRGGAGEEQALLGMVDQARRLRAGDVVGPFRLRRPLGEGGMGVVFDAQQESPVERRVALKLIRSELWGTTAVTRFARERQVLARMTHPGIAQVYDAGATPEGRAWVAMELVAGDPITVYCDRQRLTTRERLELFVQICHAVQHAHQKGIAHRDLKPSNVLVTEVDGEARPKVIDFGIARAIEDPDAEGPDSEASRFTRAGELLGTPEYMSPEQTLGGPVDTRSDVYSLGVVLHELLVGRVPVEAADQSVEAADEMRRRIREQPLRRPSTHATASGERLRELAQRRSTEPRSLRRELRGDLDWIVLRALEKEPDRRYSSAAALAGDITRHLEHRPVEVGSPSRFYRGAKLVRRHRLAVTAGVVVAASLAATAVFTTLLFLQAERARRQAEAQERTAREVSAFLQEMLAGADPVATQAREALTVREVLDDAAWRVGSRLEDFPEVASALHLTMGNAYENLGLYDRAEQSFAAALELSPDLTDPSSRVEGLLEMASLHRSQGRLDPAQELFSQALEQSLELSPSRASLVSRSRSGLAVVLRDRGSYEESEALLRQALADSELGDDPESRGLLLHDLASLLTDRGRYEEAIATFEQALVAARGAYGDHHTQVAQTLNDFALALTRAAHEERAIEISREALEIQERVYPAGHPTVAVARAIFAGSLREVERFDEAIAQLEQALADMRAALGPDHPFVAYTVNNLALAFDQQGDVERAVAGYREAVQLLVPVLGEDNPNTASTRLNYARVLRRAGDVAAAERECRESLRVRRAVLREGHPDVARNLFLLGQLRMDEEDYEGALPFLHEALEVRVRGLPPEHPQIASSQTYLGRAETALGRYHSAERHLLSAYETFEVLAAGPDPTNRRSLASTARALFELYEAWDKPEQAALYRRQSGLDAESETSRGETARARTGADAEAPPDM